MEHEIRVILKIDDEGCVTNMDVKTTLPHDDVVVYWLIKATDKVNEKKYQQFIETGVN